MAYGERDDQPLQRENHDQTKAQDQAEARAERAHHDRSSRKTQPWPRRVAMRSAPIFLRRRRTGTSMMWLSLSASYS